MDPAISSDTSKYIKVKLVDEKRQNYICGECKNLLRNAVQTTCGHWLCECCAEDLFHAELTLKIIIARCPICNEQLRNSDGTMYFPDNFVRRNIKELRVACLFPKCQWTGQHQESDDHYRVHHLEYTVKPEQRGLASKGVVDLKKLEVAASTSKQANKLRQEILSDKRKLFKKEQQLSGMEEQLSKTILEQVEDADPVRIDVNVRVESAAQSTASLGRAGEQSPNEKSSTLNADGSNEMAHFEIEPVSSFQSAVSQTDSTSKTALVTGACGANSSNRFPVREQVELKPKETSAGTCTTNQQSSDHTQLAPPLAQSTLLPPIVDVTENGSSSNSPPRSPTSALAEIPSTRMRRHRRHSSLPVIIPSPQPRGQPQAQPRAQPRGGRKQATASAQSGDRYNHLHPSGRQPLAPINGNGDKVKTKPVPKCHSCSELIQTAMQFALTHSDCDHQCTPDGKCYEKLLSKFQECINR